MLNVTRLLCGAPGPGDALRYGDGSGHPSSISAVAVHHRPVVVWNVTRRCNLLCVHCYTASNDSPAPDELTHDEAVAVLDDLASFGVPVILFSGGEPLMRPDVYDLMGRAVALGLQAVLSTNGTLLDAAAVEALKAAGVRRVGISLDGLGHVNDVFRGVSGAYERALAGIRRAIEAGFRVSLRITVTRYNVDQLGGIFDLVEREGIPRLCIYHLAYAGRGRRLLPADLDQGQRRAMMDTIFQRTVRMFEAGRPVEVLTVDNHADGPYLVLWAQRHRPERVGEIRRLLARNGGNSAGKGIACIDERGWVHPDQFWRTQRLGNVRRRPFSAIWQEHPLLAQLRDRHPLLPRRCRECRWLSVCNGNLRARAEAATGDPWGEDPACYLTEAERAGSPREVVT